MSVESVGRVVKIREVRYNGNGFHKTKDRSQPTEKCSKLKCSKFTEFHNRPLDYTLQRSSWLNLWNPAETTRVSPYNIFFSLGVLCVCARVMMMWWNVRGEFEGENNETTTGIIPKKWKEIEFFGSIQNKKIFVLNGINSPYILWGWGKGFVWRQFFRLGGGWKTNRQRILLVVGVHNIHILCARAENFFCQNFS